MNEGRNGWGKDLRNNFMSESELVIESEKTRDIKRELKRFL